MPKPRVYDLNDRLVRFATSVSYLVTAFPPTESGQHIGRQLLRSSSAPAAHHAEAQAAESRRDFVHKLRLGLKELKETRTWLNLADAQKLNPVQPIQAECEELIAILAKSVQTALKRPKR